jgi:hypothetical protein
MLDVIDDCGKALGAFGGEPCNPDTLDAFVQGVRFGVLHERFLSLIDGRYQSLWLTETKGRKAGRKSRLTKARQRPDYASRVKELMDGGMRYTPACEAVAGEFGTTSRTVRNHTAGLRPGRRVEKR